MIDLIFDVGIHVDVEAAEVVPRLDHCTLHWMQLKFMVLTFKAFNGQGLTYL